ncbi:hypothetical protein S83_001324, partial [Arachis hypogaea]
AIHDNGEHYTLISILFISFNFQDGDELTRLHCFCHIRDHVIGFIESINRYTQYVGILSKAKARASLSMNGKDNEVKLKEEETTYLKDRLLPTVIGLLSK